MKRALSSPVRTILNDWKSWQYDSVWSAIHPSLYHSTFLIQLLFIPFILPSSSLLCSPSPLFLQVCLFSAAAARDVFDHHRVYRAGGVGWSGWMSGYSSLNDELPVDPVKICKNEMNPSLNPSLATKNHGYSWLFWFNMTFFKSNLPTLQLDSGRWLSSS